jgi:hypothetical protein
VDALLAVLGRGWTEAKLQFAEWALEELQLEDEETASHITAAAAPMLPRLAKRAAVRRERSSPAPASKPVAAPRRGKWRRWTAAKRC